MDFNKETALVEAVLFLESEPLSVKMISNKSQLSEEVVEQCLEKLKERYSSNKQEVGIIYGQRIIFFNIQVCIMKKTLYSEI